MSTTFAETVPVRGSMPTRLIRSELRKIRTTKTWWLFGIGVLGATAVALLVDILQAHQNLHQGPPGSGASAEDQTTYAAAHSVATQAANVFTAGQFFGCLFVTLLAILLITNEYYHQTATTTFLTTPHRTAVILAKFATAMLAAAVFWIVTTAIDLVVGSIYFGSEHLATNPLRLWPVQQAILLNLMVFALWAVFGVGLGVLLRSQIGATVTATLSYTIGIYLALGIFALIHQFLIKKDGVFTAMVIVPAVASEVAISPMAVFPHSPPQWVGAVVLIGYGLLTGAVGVAIMRRRDIS